jgi:hypothetical protein
VSEQRRITIMAGIFVLLIFANFYNYVIQDDFDNAGFFGGPASIGDYNPRVQGALNALKEAPELNFRFEREEEDPDFEALRNPFIFGVDQQLERERQAEMERLAAIREQMAEQAQQVEPMQAQVIEMTPEEKALKEFGGKILGIMEDKETASRVAVVRIDEEILIIGPDMDVGSDFKCVSINYGKVTLERKQDGQRFELSLESE